MESDSNIKSIPITVNKSHLVTIGEKLYANNLDLVRELVCNSYDADATKVKVIITENELIVEDNGCGMDEQGLRQYFNIGSTYKKDNPQTRLFKRRKIGEFGIGKFAALSLVNTFEITTQKESFRAGLIFDKTKWSADSSWDVPINILSAENAKLHGTKVKLVGIKKNFLETEVARYLREKIPLSINNFQVFINDNLLEETSVPGRQYKFTRDTSYGIITGNIVIANKIPKSEDLVGIHIKVRGISVERSLFGFEQSHAIGVNRLRGTVEADFLPITSSRDQVIKSTKEYQIFEPIVREEIQKVLRIARNLNDNRFNQKASLVLRNALDKIGRSIKKNLYEFSADNRPFGEEQEEPDNNSQEGYHISRTKFEDQFDQNSQVPPSQRAIEKHKQKKRHISLKAKAIIRKLNFKDIGVTCRMERLGKKEIDCFTEQGIVYINMDHPLFAKQEDNESLLTMHVSRLITQELALIKYPFDAHKSFKLQSQLLTDAFGNVRKI